MRLAPLLLLAVVACSGTPAVDDFVYKPAPNYGQKEDTPPPAVPASTDSAPITPTTPPAEKVPVAPGIASITPAALTLGAVPDSGTDVVIAGHDFAAGATVKLGGALLAATVDNDKQVTVHVGAERLRDAGDQSLSVVNPGGLASNELTFTVATPSSVAIQTITPSQVTAMGSSTITIDVTGTGFIPASAARFNGAAVETVFASATKISAIVPSSMLQTPGKFSLTVSNSQTVVSLPASLSVVNPAPAITAVNPPTIRQVASTVTIEIQGQNFTSASLLYANGTLQSSQYVTVTSPTRMQVVVNGASAVGTYRLQVQTPAPGGGTSGVANFSVTY